MTMHQREITIIDVFRELGYEPVKKETWAVGGIVRNKYYEAVGALPLKKLRTKTCGVGVHCLAVYPEQWRDTIAEVACFLGLVTGAFGIWRFKKMQGAISRTLRWTHSV